MMATVGYWMETVRYPTVEFDWLHSIVFANLNRAKEEHI